MKKIITAIMTLVMFSLPANSNNIEKVLSKQHVNKSAVSISVKDADTGEIIYTLNDQTPRQPASTLKIITTAASLDTLGKDYEFTTSLYKSNNNDLYVKLGADPFLTSDDLKKLITTAKDKNIVPKTVYTDSTVFDNIEWGEGWQWDDDLNPYMPKFSAYNLDNNMINIEITPQKEGTAPTIAIKPFYPITVMNLITTKYNEKNNVTLARNNSIAPNIINANGTVSKQTVIRIPVNNPQLYFNIRLQEAIRNKKLGYYDSIKIGSLPQNNIYFVDKITNNIDKAVRTSLKDSNNLIAETVFKLAGAKYANSTGNTQNSINMLNSYFDKLGIKYEDIKIVDGSGVSKNNIITSDFMTDFLIKLSKTEDFEYYKEFMPTPGEGTLKNRMLYFKNNLRAKTGTLSNTSSITGYITTRKGCNYVFNIIIQDAKTSENDKKNIEELILREIYTN